jgi:hypothetical protein
MKTYELERRIRNAKIEIELAESEEELIFWQMHLLKLLEMLSNDKPS